MAVFVSTVALPAHITQQPASDEPHPNRSQTVSNDPQGVKAPPSWLLPHCLNLMKRKQHAEARALLDPVLSAHPEWAKAHFYLGLTYDGEDRHERAKECFERSLKLDPTPSVILIFYGKCLYKLGEPKAARAQFESYLAADPDHAEATFSLGLIDFDDDRIDAARARFLKAIDLAQAQKNQRMEAKTRARLADVYVREGNLEEARKQLDRSIELNPNNYEPYFKLSRVLQRLGDAAGAQRAREMHQQVRERVRGSSKHP